MYVPFSQFTVPKGVISVIGSGGKTSFLRYMADTLPGKVILTTTTHMYPFADLPLILTSGNDPVLPDGKDSISSGSVISEVSICDSIRGQLADSRVICLGSPGPSGKLSAPDISFTDLLSLADHILVEADGSRGFPLKAHRKTEPVIPCETAMTVCLIGASGIGARICDVCHCPQLFSELAGVSQDQTATPERIARVINAESLANLYFINQTDLAEDEAAVYDLCKKIKKPAAAGSLQKQRFL